jgi:hypothetical protein
MGDQAPEMMIWEMNDGVDDLSMKIEKSQGTKAESKEREPRAS